MAWYHRNPWHGISEISTHKMIFKDSKLMGDLTNFLDTFKTYAELGTVTSEKGNNYRTASTQFETGSLFSFIETNLTSSSTYLICDDMGVEWGDFISATDDEISFYHAKYHESGLSATNLEEVFGQVQKNLGFLELTEEMIDKRKNRWQNNYRIGSVNTSIKRIRKCPQGKESIDDVKHYINQVSSNGNLKRKIFVIINFISKSELEKALGFLKDGKIFHNKGVILQILWFVNALLASANELAVEFRIICRP